MQAPEFNRLNADSLIADSLIANSLITNSLNEYKQAVCRYSSIVFPPASC